MDIKDNLLKTSTTRSFLEWRESKNENLAPHSFSEAEIMLLETYYDFFEKQKKNLFDFIKDIRFLPRKEQAKIIKTNYGTKNIKSKIAFRILDSNCEKSTLEEDTELFIFCSKFIDK